MKKLGVAVGSILTTLVLGAVLVAVLTEEGLPIQMEQISSTMTPEGKRRFIWRTDGFVCLNSDNTFILNKPGYEGHIGVHGNCTYVSVGDNQTLSLVAKHLPPDVAASVPEWIEEARSQYPDLTVIPVAQNVLQWDGSEWTAATKLQGSLEPTLDCLGNCTRPFALEYIADVSGPGVENLVLPNKVEHRLYRVPRKP